MSDDKSFVDQIILESRLAQQRVDKLFERLEGCEKKLQEISQDLDRLMQLSKHADHNQQSPVYHNIPHGCGDNMIGDYHRRLYEQGMRRQKLQEQSTDGKQEE